MISSGKFKASPNKLLSADNSKLNLNFYKADSTECGSKRDGSVSNSKVAECYKKPVHGAHIKKAINPPLKMTKTINRINESHTTNMR